MYLKRILATFSATAMFMTTFSIGALQNVYAVDEYVAAEDSVTDMPNGQCGEKVNWKFNEETGVLTISGEGPMYQDDYKTYDSWSYSNYLSKATEVVFEDDITEIGACAFANASAGSVAFPNLTKVKLPANLQKIDAFAFKFLPIKSIELPESLVSIGEHSFAYSELESVKLNKGMTIGGCAFQSCNSLKEISIPMNLKFEMSGFGGQGNFYGRHFSECKSLEKVTIEEGATELPDRIFTGCKSIKEVVVYSVDLTIVANASNNSRAFDNYKNIIFKLYENSKSEKTLRDAGYITEENTVHMIYFKNLEDAIIKAEKMDLSNYSDESVAKLKAAIDAGKTVLSNENATQKEVDAAVMEIEYAINSLIEKTEPTTVTTKVGPTTTATSKTTRSTDDVKKDKEAAEKLMKQAKITKLKAKSKAKKKIAVSWKKVSKAKGYQVQVSKSKKFKKTILSKFTLKKKLTIKHSKLKSGKTYYVRVRAYATYNDINNKTQKVYSKWNKKLRKVTVK